MALTITRKRNRLEEPASFATRLAGAMSVKQVSASEVARLVNVTPTAVWNWRNNNSVPRPQVLSAIAKALDVSEEYLLSGSGPHHDDVSSPSEPATRSVAEILDDVRIEIARLTGFPPDRVKLHLELVSD
ncbi:helix-turn-helix domain-containing protein [Mesorhizobium sp.]|uniref:helix-turn-helix domain-containing protein n=1 Tax=Mesorhizobium sp. TaxID=1871066 RepID=UPI000FE4A600|nr:helix-turn-helix domain-containing protein [Mesorhizobium sp.]RWD33483.1 MAG: helix-turn-helix domain-containing protein [Mesorhizobium sp.]